jgi:hypothetical protein
MPCRSNGKSGLGLYLGCAFHPVPGAYHAVPVAIFPDLGPGLGLGASPTRSRPDFRRCPLRKVAVRRRRTRPVPSRCRRIPRPLQRGRFNRLVAELQSGPFSRTYRRHLPDGSGTESPLHDPARERRRRRAHDQCQVRGL